MKRFHDETDAAAATADLIIQASWRVMRIVRAAVESGKTTDLTMTQLQTLGFLFASPGASLSAVSQHLGLQLPTTSKVVDSLVQQGRVARQSVAGNRRKLSLELTAAGRKVMASAARPGMLRMAELIAQLDERELGTLQRAMSLLQPIMHSAAPSTAATETGRGGTRPPSRARRGVAAKRIMRGHALPGETITVQPATSRR